MSARPDDRVAVERAVQFGLWCLLEQGGAPTIEATKRYLRCSRATAYRWVRAYRNAATAATVKTIAEAMSD